MADIDQNVKGEVCPPLPAGTMKRAALAYAEQGLKIFPCHRITSRGVCSCGNAECKSPGKHPRTAHGYDDATADVKTVADWWSDWPEANIGLACSANYMVALDVDPRHKGDEDFAELEATHGPIVSSCVADTGGGGQHHVFSFSGPKDVELIGKIGTNKGIDVKHKGYILVAPSNHLSGKRYAWREGMAPVADGDLGGIVAPPLPGWVRDMKRSSANKGTTSKAVDLGWYRFAAATMAIPNAGDEFDRDGWLRIGAAIHAQAAGSEDGLALFMEWSAAHPTFDAAETERVYRSFSSSRTGSAVTGATILHEAKAAGHVLPARPQTTGEAFGAVDDGEPVRKPRKAAAVYLADLMAEPAEPLEQLVKGVLTAAEIAVASGAPGAGKTTGMQHLGLCVAAGADFHGRRTKPGGTLYIGTENRGEDERRLRANLKRHGRDDCLPFRFLPRGVKLYDEQARPTMDEREVIKLALEMEPDTGHRCKLIIVDNLRRVIAPGSTSDEANVTVVMKALERIRDATGAAVVIIHHNVRGEARYSGSGAIESHADSVWQFGPAKGRKTHAITFEKLRLGDKRQELQFTFGFEVVAHDSDGDEIRTVVAVDVDTTASALGPVDDDTPTLEAAAVVPEVADDLPERVEMMGQAAREISTTRERFNAKELYAATNGVRLALGLDKLGATTLDMVREALIGSGALRVEGHGRARSYSVEV